MSKDTVKLASGHQIPLVGFGLWKVPKETAADTVYNVGYAIESLESNGEAELPEGYQGRL